MRQRKLLFVGKSGAGKGTQAGLLTRLGFEHISTRELIRSARKRQDPRVMPYIESLDVGELLPDEETVDLLDEALDKLGDSSYILDGAIRNISQAELGLQRGLYDEIFHFYINNDTVNRRMTRRFEVEGRKDDSIIESRLEKLEIYRTQTKPILEYSRERGIPVYEVNAAPANSKNKAQSIELVNESILRTLIFS